MGTRIHAQSTGSSRSDWQTPQWLLELVREVIGGPIELDPASSATNPTQALGFYTPTDDGLRQPWSAGSIFLNPPWSRVEGVDLRDWLSRAHGVRGNQHLHEDWHMFVLVSASMNANWFHKWLDDCDAYFFPKGRVRYNSPDPQTPNDAPGFDSVLCYSGTDRGLFLHKFRPFGLVLYNNAHGR